MQSAGDFQWHFPKNIDLFHELWRLEDASFSLAGAPLKLSDAARDTYGRYALGESFIPSTRGADPTIQQPQRRPREFLRRSTPVVPAERDVPSNMGDLHPADTVDRSNAKVPPVTIRRFNALVNDEDFSLRAMGQFRVHPPVHPTKRVPFSQEAWDDIPIDLWSPTDFWADEGVDELPCANCGLGHARFVHIIKEKSWRSPRLIKGPFGEDVALAGRQCVCYECRRIKNRWKAHLQAAHSNLADPGTIAAIQKKVDSIHPYFLTTNPVVNMYLGIRHPFVLALFEYHITHKAALDFNALMMLARAARTSQSACDLEASFDEFRSTRRARRRTAFVSTQMMARAKHQRDINFGVTTEPVPDWVHMAESESKISDNYIRTSQSALFDEHETYIFQWQEQCVKATPLSSSDHHGKKTARLRQGGVKLLNWSYEEFNDIGQSVIHILVNTTSYGDASLVAAYDARFRASVKWGHPARRRLYIDNPHKDGKGALANTHPEGPGNFRRPPLDFRGLVLEVRTHNECKNAIALLSSTPNDVFGFDTERVAYIKEHAGQGTSSDKAAIAQI